MVDKKHEVEITASSAKREVKSLADEFKGLKNSIESAKKEITELLKSVGASGKEISAFNKSISQTATAGRNLRRSERMGLPPAQAKIQEDVDREEARARRQSLNRRLQIERSNVSQFEQLAKAVSGGVSDARKTLSKEMMEFTQASKTASNTEKRYWAEYSKEKLEAQQARREAVAADKKADREEKRDIRARSAAFRKLRAAAEKRKKAQEAAHAAELKAIEDKRKQATRESTTRATYSNTVRERFFNSPEGKEQRFRNIAAISQSPTRRLEAEIAATKIAMQRLEKSGEDVTEEYLKQERLLNSQQDSLRRLKALEHERANSAQSYNSVMTDRARDPAAVRSVSAYGSAIATDRIRGSQSGATFRNQFASVGNFAAIGGIMGAGFFAQQFVVQYEEALKDLQAITASSDATMQGFRNTIDDVASSTKFTAVEVARAAKVLGQAGFNAEQVGDSLGAVARFASATGTEIEKAVDIMTSAMSVFNLRAVEGMALANQFTAAINQSKLNSEKLTLGFQYSANLAAQSGASVDELVASLAGLANAGLRSGSTIGTNLRAFLVDLKDPTEDLMNRLSDLGLTLNDIDVRSQGIIGVVQNLSEAGFGASSAFQTLETRAGNAFLALEGQLDTLREIQMNILGTSAAIEASDTQMESLANTGRNFQSVMGSALMTSFEPLMRQIQDILEGFNSILADLTGRFPGALRAFGAVLSAGVGLAIGNVLVRITRMSVATDTNRQRTLASTAAIQNWGRALAVSGAMSDKASGSIRRLTGAMVANAGTARAMAGATTLASRAFAAMGGPLGLAIMAVTAVAYAIDNAKQKIRDLETAADEATGAFESANSAYDQHTTTIETLNTEIASLIAQEQSLIEDNERLQARIMSLNDRFADLGLYLDATGSSYENLISRVRDLRDAFYEQGDAAAASQLITARGQRAALSQVIGPDGGRLENRLFGGRDNLRELLAFTTGNTNGEYIRQQARQITTDMTPTGAVARSDGEVARGLLEVTGQDDRLSSVNALLTQIAQGGALSANSGQYQQAALELSRIGEDELPGLASALNDFTARVRSYELSIRQEEAAERELAIQNRVGSKTANMTIARAEELRREFETIRREIQSDPELSTDRTAMEAAFLERMGPIEDVLDSYFNGAFQDPESREVARRSGSLGMLEELRGDLRTLFSSLAENAAEAGAARSRISVSEQQFNLRDAQGALRNARDDGEFERARDQVRQTVRALVDQELAQFATNDLGLSPNQFEVRNNQLVPTDLARQSLNTEQQASLVLKNREGAAQVEAAERNIDRAEERRRVDALRTEIDGLRSDISQRKAEQDFLSLENQQMLNEDFGREEAVGALERERELLDEILAKEMEIAELRYRIDNPNATDEQVFAAMAPLRAEQDRQRQLADAETQNEINTLPITNTDDVMGAVMQDNRFTQMDRDATSLAQTLRESMNAAIDSVRQNLGQMFTDIISGTKSAGEAFAQFGTNIISTIAQVMMNKVVEKFTQWIIDTLGAGAGGGGGMAGALMNLGASLFGGGKKSSYQGGIVRANAGRIVRASNGIKTRDAQMIYAQDGEGILRKSAMQSIGEDGFRRLNALGNRALDSGRSIAAMPAGPVPRDTVNVYAVLPEEKPVPGPKDIVAIINDDIRKGGSTKKFIKGVQTGQV